MSWRASAGLARAVKTNRDFLCRCEECVYDRETTVEIRGWPCHRTEAWVFMSYWREGVKCIPHTWISTFLLKGGAIINSYLVSEAIYG